MAETIFEASLRESALKKTKKVLTIEKRYCKNTGYVLRETDRGFPGKKDSGATSPEIFLRFRVDKIKKSMYKIGFVETAKK